MSVSTGYVKKELPSKVLSIGIALTVIGVLLSAIFWVADFHRAVHNYMLVFFFLLTIGGGALFIVALEYIAGAIWSVPLRRVIEFVAGVIPITFVLAIPLLFNLPILFEWMDPKIVANDHLVHHKAGYLNEQFFLIRFGVTFALWTLFYFLFTRRSLKQDETKDQGITTRNIKLAAVFIPIFAISLSLSGIDWLMTIEPHWFSTIFGVYIFSGSMVGALAVIAFAVVKLNENGYLHTGMVQDHYYSVGALLFAFVAFWAYIALSQFLLIWYANLPETTFWYIYRSKGAWFGISMLFIVVHFIVPFALLLPKKNKMNPKILKFVSVWVFFAHMFDIYWLYMPSFTKQYGFAWTSLLEIAAPILATGILIIAFYFSAKNKNKVAVGDPKLERGLNFRL